MIFVDVDDTKKLMVNSLNGTMDEIDIPTFETLSKWRSLESISAGTETESELLDTLQSRGYLVKNDAEEAERKEKILVALRKNHEFDRNNCRHLTFIMTYDCNYRCPYCFEGEEYVKTAVMTPELVDEALKLTSDENLQTILLFGGEPLLPKTRKTVEYIFSKCPDKIYTIITNGYYLEEYVELLSIVNIYEITVTIDGLESTHNSRRYLANGEPTYQKIIKGVTCALAAELPIKLRVNVSHDNLQEGLKLQKLLLEQFGENNKFLKFELSPMLGYSHEEKSKIMGELFEQVAHLDNVEIARRNTAFVGITPVVSALTTGRPLSPEYSHCYAHKNNLIVDPYGEIYTCLVAVGKEYLAAGKYYPTVEFREHSIRNRNIDQIPECRECVYSLLCGGGCPMSISEPGNLYKPSCSNIQSAIHSILPKVYQTKIETQQQ